MTLTACAMFQVCSHVPECTAQLPALALRHFWHFSEGPHNVWHHHEQCGYRSLGDVADYFLQMQEPIKL